MFVLNFLIALVLLCGPSPGYADNYDAILGFQDLRLSTLAAADLITEQRPNVFVFRNARPPDEIEVSTGMQLASMFHRPILLLSNIQVRGEYVGGFDAILFSSGGEPTHNVSLKSTFETQRRMKDWMRSRASEARTSLINATSRLSQTGHSPSRREQMLIRLLGIRSFIRRPSILVLDLSRLGRSVVQCEQGNLTEGTCDGELVRGLRPLFPDSPFDIELALFSNAQFYFSRTNAGLFTPDVNLLTPTWRSTSRPRHTCQEMFSRATQD